MAIHLAQTPEELQRGFNVQSNAEIISIRLMSGILRSSSPAEFLKSGRPIEFRVGQKVGSAGVNPDHVLGVAIDCGLWAIPPSDAEKPPAEVQPVFVVTATFEARYQLQESYHPTPEEVKAFAEGNVVFNVWPFFREFAQNTAMRFGFPGDPTIPFLRLVSKPTEATQPPENQESLRLAVGDPSGTTPKRQPRKRSRATFRAKPKNP
jgi:hypothetical protein